MSKVKEKESQLVLVGRTANYFDVHLHPSYDLSLKFIMFKEHEDAELKMLFMETFHPFDYHPQAILFLMQEKKLESIITNGGGKVIFDLDSHTIIFSGYSKSFGNFCPAEVSSIAHVIWPDFNIKFENMPGSAEETVISGRKFTIQQMGYLTKNI